MRRLRQALARLVLAVLVAATALIGWAWLRGRPQDLPWTPLDLAQPIGLVTGRKLAALGDEGAACRGLLRRAGVRYVALPARHDGACGYEDGVRLERGGALHTALNPAGPALACPVAAALAVWVWQVVQPAALARLGSAVTEVDHFGSYNCRPIAGSDRWSEHAHADAIDVAGFRLADGSHVTVARDWHGDGPKARFLREVRDGACRLFATTLSPDYNHAHANHLHLDEAPRGTIGWRACR